MSIKWNYIYVFEFEQLRDLKQSEGMFNMLKYKEHLGALISLNWNMSKIIPF